MEIGDNEVSVVYKDFFTKNYKIDVQELERIIKDAKDESIGFLYR